MGQTNKHEGLNLMFVNHRQEDRLYHLTTIEIAKHKKKDHQIYSKNMQKHHHWIDIFILLKT